MRLPLASNGLQFLAISAILAHTAADVDITLIGQSWIDELSRSGANGWFDDWNPVMQAKFDELAEIAEAENKSDPFIVLMVGDSTMRHQFGAMCAFMSRRSGRRFDPKDPQLGKPGCCIDTAEGGGRGLCFAISSYRFLNPSRAKNEAVDGYYFGCGMHLLHMTPEEPLDPLRVQEWLAYEKLLDKQVRAVRKKNNGQVRIAFMTTHIVEDDKYIDAFAEIRDAYRLPGGNQTIRDICEAQVPHASIGDTAEFYNWEGRIDLSRYTKIGEGNFNTSSYCSEGLRDRHGSVQLNRRARRVMARLGVPLVDAARIVEGQKWATPRRDGRHYHRLVPLETFALLQVLTSPPPPPLYRQKEMDGDLPLVDEFYDFRGSPIV